ncbi:PASTA domain-containing protein [Streptomyces microflavus]|uniref:PASTA domain-containing protein n=1 Tax=Streptomyces microflavus TaxID=1919 RepID=UPI002E30A305|nr:PASTA domain-containing protein [Streptomyces microflavus]
MRTPHRLALTALVAVLALAGCSGGARTDDSAPATASPSSPSLSSPSPPPASSPPASRPPAPPPPSATTETLTPTAPPPPTSSTTPTPPPDPVMPALHSRTYEQARAELARAGVSTARLTPGAQHKDVTVPRDHDGWYICDTSPRPGAPVTAATTVTVRLARDFSDCTTSFNGYLHQENDPAHTP